jgi:asparagine synthase (glutamine-hydrolysing)
MCGIGGFYVADDSSLGGADTLQTMVRVLRHRGPDDEGIWLNPSNRIGLAHTRLAIIDLSPAGHQPMISGSGRFALAFNGEIYNYRVLASELAKAGFQPRGHSDTEVLLAGFEYWGVEATLRKAAGMFALAIVDNQTGTMSLARDRLGEKPLYLAQAGSSYLFASELGALTAITGTTTTLDMTALSLYLRRNYIPAPWTIYSNIRKVEPGTCVTLTRGAIGPVAKTTRFWHYPGDLDAAQVGSGSATLEELDATLRTVVREQMISDRPLGAFLSGGIDSSLIAMLMQEESSQPVQTFTVGFDDQAFNELPFARDVAQRLGTDHHEIMLGASAGMDLIDELPRVYGEPCADSSQIPTLLVTREARRHVVVALSGDGGDENFGGYERYFEVLASWQRIERVPAWLRPGICRLLRLGDQSWLDGGVGRTVNTLLRRNPSRRLSSVFRHAAEVLGAGTLQDRYLDYHPVWARPGDALAVANGAAELPRPGFTMPRGATAPITSQIHRLMAIDMRAYLPDDILVKVDRASMSVGLECRAPLLDHRVVEVAWRLAAASLAQDGRGKYPLRQLLTRRLPAELFERRKQGFAVPIGQWLRSSLRDWAEDLLSEKSLSNDAPFLNAREIRRRWSEHVGGVWDNSAQLWGILQLVRWCRTQPQPPRAP